METNKASQSTAAALEGNAPENTPAGGDEAAAAAQFTHTHTQSVFLGAQCVFGLFILIPKQCLLPSFFLGFNF